MELIKTPPITVDPEPQLIYPNCPHCKGKQGQLVSETGVWFSCVPCDGMGALEEDMVIADAQFCREHHAWRKRHDIPDNDKEITQKELQMIFSGYHSKVPFIATRLLFRNPPNWTTNDLLAALQQIAYHQKTVLMVTVPFTPSIAMVDAGCEAVDQRPSVIRKIYEAMIRQSQKTD